VSLLVASSSKVWLSFVGEKEWHILPNFFELVPFCALGLMKVIFGQLICLHLFTLPSNKTLQKQIVCFHFKNLLSAQHGFVILSKYIINSNVLLLIQNNCCRKLLKDAMFNVSLYLS